MKLDVAASKRPVFWFAVMACLFVATNFKVLFINGIYEYGDHCLTALDVYQAKHFRAILGLYSRWNFHHPGPAFSYIFALGEFLFRDLLPVAATRYTSYILISGLFQLGLYTWAAEILVRRLRQPWMVLPFFFMLWAHLYFARLDDTMDVANSQFHIWLSFVLLGPFVLFVIACASFSLGATRDLLPALIASGLLLHLHASQPLFVVPIASIALFQHLRARKKPGIERRERSGGWVWVLACCAVVLVFSLPLVVDFSRGSESNFARLLAYVRSHHELKTFKEAVGYSLSFLAYPMATRVYPSGFYQSLSPLQWFSWIGWIGIGIGSILLVRAARAAMLTRLGCYTVLAAILSLLWSRKLEGDMYWYDAWVDLAIMALVLVPPSYFLANGLARLRRSSQIAFLLTALVAVGFFWSQSYDAPAGYVRPKAITDAAHLISSHHLTGNDPIWLSMDFGSWTAAACAANELVRSGIPFEVDDAWKTMFQGYSKAVPPGMKPKERWRFQENGAIEVEGPDAYPPAAL